ncbi:EpsG family protein [Riemerella anatipestifer]|uniref:EpsG family protein n=1 Tax=Riemerella anatipestifer TaxID=34085 RepID=UPI00129E0B27|nr:EpsG family protein [Riemerella anatipestifer]MRM83558.1 EpsG family protein [Riemerella anatipestifer]
MKIVFLHPIFTIITIILIAYSFLEVYNYKNYKSVWAVVFVMILLVGFRSGVGADYGVYVQMYEYFGQKTAYTTVYNKAFFSGSERLDIEWLYVLVGKYVYDFGFPFFIFTFVVALFSILPKYFTFENAVVYPSLSLLLYMFPSYFTADGGHMRQAVSMSILIFSFHFIKKRNLPLFLLMIYLAMGFHKSAAIFILAYWIALIPMTKTRIILFLVVSAILSPFQVYQYFSLFDTLAPAEVYEGFSAYETIENSETTGRISFTDMMAIFYGYFLVTYNEEACEKIPYYEYMRNIALFGICLSFIFRGSPIFSSRLAMIYMIFIVMVLPNIIAAVGNEKHKKYLHLIIVCFAIFYYFVYGSLQATRAGYTWYYSNYLW